MPTESNKIIDMIFEIMREKNISQTELSNSLHWTKSKLSKVLNNQQRLTTDDLYDMSAALGIANPAILMKADIDAVDSSLWGLGQITEAMTLFAKAEDYSDQKQIIENHIAPIFSSYLSLMTDGRVARAKDNRMMFNSASMGRLKLRGEPIHFHWGVMVRDINPLLDKTNRLTVGLWWNGDRDIVYLAIVLKEYVPKDAYLIEELHELVEKNGDSWSLEKKIEEIPFFRRGLICNKEYHISDINDELQFKSEILKGYDLYTELVEYYMDMVMKGFAESRKEAVELSKNQERMITSQAKNRAIALKSADYHCEFNSEHQTFIDKKTDKPYMEVVHIIPFYAQNSFGSSLDVPANLCCLCPNCAARIRNSNDADRQEMLMQIYMKHKEELEKAGLHISLMELFKANGME